MSQYIIKKLPGSYAEIAVELDEATLNTHIEKAYAQLSKQADIPGFRKGHVPRAILEQRYTRADIIMREEQHLLEEVLQEIFQKNELNPVGPVEKIDVVSYEPYKALLTLPIYPEYSIKDYKGIKVEKLEVAVPLDEVKKEMERIEMEFADFVVDPDGAIMSGDIVYLDFQGMDEHGVLIETLKGTHYPLYVKDEVMVEGFREEILGLKVGDKKEFSVTYPETHSMKQLHGMKVTFHVEVKEIKKVVKKEISADDLEKLLGEKIDPKDLESHLTTKLKAMKEEDEKARREKELEEKVQPIFEGEIPQVMIDKELDIMLSKFQRHIESMGFVFQDYLTHIKKSPEDLRTEWREEAQKRIVFSLVLSKISEDLKIEPTDQELEQEVAWYVSQGKDEEEKALIHKAYTKGGMYHNQIQKQVMLRTCIDHFTT